MNYILQSEEELHFEVHRVLKKFNDLVSKRSLQILNEFVPDDKVLLVGSDAGETAKGMREIKEFFDRVFARDVTFSWDWDCIDISHRNNLIWLFAEGWVIQSTLKEQKKTPYRITGILEFHEERWLWRHYHGSEPVINT